MENAPFPTAAIICDTHCWLEARVKLARFFDHVFLYHRNYLPCSKSILQVTSTGSPMRATWNISTPLGVTRPGGGLHRAVASPDKTGADYLEAGRSDTGSTSSAIISRKKSPGCTSRCKIVLNLPLADDLNFRTFEAMSCGALLLTPKIANGQEVLFREGVHYAALPMNGKCLKKWIITSLIRKKERPSPRRGCRRYGPSTGLEQRIEEILAIVQGDLTKRRRFRRMSPSEVDRQYAWLYGILATGGARLKLARAAREAGRPWLPLLLPAARSILASFAAMSLPVNGPSDQLGSSFLKRFCRGLTSGFLGQVLSAASAIILVPLFLQAWGPRVTAGGCSLTALISYLSLLDLVGRLLVGNLLAQGLRSG